MTQRRTVFFVSDGTGITAQMLGHSLMTQFEGVEFNQVTLPFVDSIEVVEQRARTLPDGNLSGSTRKTERHSGHTTFMPCLPSTRQRPGR